MPHETGQDLIDRLETILEQERQALTGGDLAMLTEIVPQKEQLVDALNELDHLEHRALDKTQNQLHRNQLLLHSAMLGIRAAAARMTDLRKTRESLDIYDDSGRKTRHGMRACGKLEKRA